MGKQIVWEDRFNIGVEAIDREHKKLFGIINKLLALKDQEDKSQWICQEGIKYFKDHAMKHFTQEEAYMAAIHYIGFDTHRRIHDDFRQKILPGLEEELSRTRYSQDSVNHFLGVCAGWLIGHTLTEDRAITGKSTSKWVNLLPEDEHVAMRQTIIQLLYDLFRLQARVISESYGGEKFGNGIYYRLVYGSSKGERWEIILVFEEKLLARTIGKMMGSESDKMNVMLMNAARHTARQFVNRVAENFPSAGLSEMWEESLLTYEQFQKRFENERPQFSLLFNTGEGYFAYCVIAPHLVYEKLGTSIEAKNAVEEVKKYLEENETSHKKKVLVVDDSSVMQHTMKQLLEKDYEVSLAKSAMSAIQSITLDKPDLVLLDYEMPGCNGSQVLEMIRSEEEFSSIPVMFLTSRVDKETVNKVLALKPNGYLPKQMPLPEIKKMVDNYFKKFKR